MWVLTAGTAGEAAVMVEAPHSLAGLVGSIHCLVTFITHSCEDITNKNTGSDDGLKSNSHTGLQSRIRFHHAVGAKGSILLPMWALSKASDYVTG